MTNQMYNIFFFHYNITREYHIGSTKIRKLCLKKYMWEKFGPLRLVSNIR